MKKRAILAIALLLSGAVSVYSEEVASTTTVAETTKSTEVADASNPFSDNEQTSLIASVIVEIIDKATAKAAGIESVKDGFPMKGTVDGLKGGNLRLRAWPWGNVIGEYKHGTAVEILGKTGEFYLVNINGKQGYMHENFITTSSNKATGGWPYYPGNTASGAALSLEEGIKISNAGQAARKTSQSTATTKTTSNTSSTVANTSSTTSSNTTVAKTTSSSSNSSNSSSSSTNVSSSTTNKGGIYAPYTGYKGKKTVTSNSVVLDMAKLPQMSSNTPNPKIACGPTTLAMTLSYFGKGSPNSIVRECWNACNCTDGTTTAKMLAACKKCGFPNSSWHNPTSPEWVRSQLNKGIPVISFVNHHWVVIKGIKSNNTVIINDPGRSVVERSMSWSEFSAWQKQTGRGQMCLDLGID